VREAGSSAQRKRRWLDQPERLNSQAEKVGKTCISVQSKRGGLERSHSLEGRFISLVGLMN